MINKQSKIMFRPTVIYTDGITEQFEAIRITKKRVGDRENNRWQICHLWVYPPAEY